MSLHPKYFVACSICVLTGGAVAICGASAALAIATILPKSKFSERDTIFTVIAVTTFSTIAMILYPLLTGFLELDNRTAGIFIGGTVHDVAQVVGAGYIISNEAGDFATVTKLFRVAMLVPIVLVLSVIFQSEKKGKRQVSFPGFHNRIFVPWWEPTVVAWFQMESGFLIDVSRWCLVTAIAALGIKTSLKSILTVGYQPIAVIFMETVFIGIWILGACMP